jgi:hypothetical protein
LKKEAQYMIDRRSLMAAAATMAATPAIARRKGQVYFTDLS